MFSSRFRLSLLVLFLLGFLPGLLPAAEEQWKVVVNADNSFNFMIFAGDKLVLKAGIGGWGPGWSWFPVESKEKGEGNELRISTVMPIGKEKPKLGLEVKAAGPRSVTFDYSLNAEHAIPILQIVATAGVPDGAEAKAVVTTTEGRERTINLPMNPADLGAVKKVVLQGPAWSGPVEITLDPPLETNGHGDMRIRLAADTIKAGATRARVTWSFPGKVELAVQAEDVAKNAPVLAGADWFTYRPQWDFGPSAIGAEDVLDKPAGKHGGVRIKGDQFVFEDGTPVKFWGTNLSYGASAPEKGDADFTAARFAKYGVNAVRFHKFTGPGWEGIGEENTAVMMKPAGMARLDYFASQLAMRGIYYGWSHSFQFKVRPGDKSRLAGFAELMKKGGNTYGVINWAEDVQDLMIEMVVGLLKHKNPYTGKTYAQDPALCYIELQNEDDIFFYTSGPAYNDFPTYARQLREHFAQWLKERYGTQEKLSGAWQGALKPGETLAAGEMAVEINPWAMSDANLPNIKGGARQRLLDNAAFLHFTQNKFYRKFVKAIRDAGYQGPLVGSPWQAPGGLPHYYNLRSDDLVGYIDRHNYFGEGFTDSMLKTPGGGYLSSGLQQVANKPFGISEWIHVYPSLYSVEGPILMAAYGMGLQGWGASYEFQSGSGRLDPNSALVGNLPWGVWNADVPSQMGQYPILARMIQRGDVRTAPAISVRRISTENLAKGQFNFADTVRQQGDIKTFSGSVPAETLAAGRALVEFVEKPAPSLLADMAKYTRGTVITSATGQLRWDTAAGGMVSISTAGTEGYVGFAGGKHLVLGATEITPATAYAAILITAADLKKNLGNDKRALIYAMARNANSGFRILTLDNRTIVDNGKAPIVLEPVQAEIAFTRRKIAQVNVLDHDGRVTGRTLPVADGKFSLDTGRDKAIYYEVVFAD